MNFIIFNNGIITAKGMSGSDRRVYNWTLFFLKRGHKVALVIPKLGEERFQTFPVDKIVINSNNFEKYGYFITYLARTILAILKIHKLPELRASSVIYSSSDLIADSIPAIILKFKNPQVKLICGLHLLAPNPLENYYHQFSVPSPKAIYYFLTQTIVIKLLKKYANLVLVSNFLDKKYLTNRGFSSEKVLVTYGAVDFSLIPKTDIKKEFEAVWVGRLHKQKGIDDIFLIWGKVLLKFPKAKLEIIGEDNIKEYFFKRGHFNKLGDSVIFSGYLSGKKLFEAIKKAKVMIFPSYYESFGMVIAEAMACGIPVVAYNLPVYYNIYPKGMIKVPLSDCKKFADEVLTLLRNNSYRNKISREATETVKKFSWKKTAEEILKHLKE